MSDTALYAINAKQKANNAALGYPNVLTFPISAFGLCSCGFLAYPV